MRIWILALALAGCSFATTRVPNVRPGYPEKTVCTASTTAPFLDLAGGIVVTLFTFPAAFGGGGEAGIVVGSSAILLLSSALFGYRAVNECQRFIAEDIAEWPARVEESAREAERMWIEDRLAKERESAVLQARRVEQARLARAQRLDRIAQRRVLVDRDLAADRSRLDWLATITKHARESAGDGDCELVVRLGVEVKAVNPAYYEANFATVDLIASCMPVN